MSEETDGLGALESKLSEARNNCVLGEVAAKEIEDGAFATLLAVLKNAVSDEDSGDKAVSADGAKGKDTNVKSRPRFARAAELLSELLAWCPNALSRDSVLSCIEAVCERVERTSKEAVDGSDTKQVLAFGCHVLWVVGAAFRDRRSRAVAGEGAASGEGTLECDDARVDALEAVCLRAATAASRHPCFKARVEAKAQVGSGRFRFGLGVAARAVARLRKEEGGEAPAAKAGH